MNQNENGGPRQDGQLEVGVPNFLEAYDTLKQCVSELRQQEEPDLDALIPLVDKALGAYKHCKGRIDAVQAMLNERLSGEAPAGGSE